MNYLVKYVSLHLSIHISNSGKQRTDLKDKHYEK